MIAFLAAMFMMTVIFAPVLATAEDGTEPVVINMLSAPTKIGIGQKQMYEFNITGGPAWGDANGTYSWSGVLGGKYGSEAQMIPATGGPIKTNTFFFNVTAPVHAGDFTVTITAKSTNGTANVTQKLVYNIQSVNPIVLTATLKNSGNVTVNAVPVAFYLSDSEPATLIYNTTVNVVGLGTQVVSYNWTTYDLKAGKHTISVQIDPNSTLVALDTGSKTATLEIYYGAEGYGGINAWLWAFVVVLAVLFYLIYRRPTKYKKKGTKKKK